MNSYSQYLAFLRGINVGGHSLIKMADLKEIFKKIGFKNVRTILATGNVSFTSGHADKKALTEKINRN